MAGSIDPIKFGQMMEKIDSTHAIVTKMANKHDQHEGRLNTLENRNKNIKENWKKVGFASATLAAFAGIGATIKSFVTWIGA